VALIAGLALIAAAAALTLSRAPLVLTGTNSVAEAEVIAATRGPFSACQSGEVIPQGTTAVRLWLEANIMSSLRVRVLAGSRTVAVGSRAGGELEKVATVAITRVPRTLEHAQLCFSITRSVQGVELLGGPPSRRVSGEPANKLRVEYLRSGPSSWWSLIGPVARRLGMGRAPAGSWVALIPLALMGLAVLLVSGTIVRQVGRERRAAASVSGPGPGRRWRSTLRRVPGPAWACAGVAFLSAASWSILTPPFQAPDEPSHFAYAQIIAETGALPKSGASLYSQQEQTVLADLNHQEVRFNEAIGTISTAAQQLRLEDDLALPLARVGAGAGVANSQPPLYYALETIPYYLGSGGTLLDQLALMRLLSALLAGLTALLAFLFLREALPAAPFAWTVGGLCAGLAPLVGFISGVVNPDALLCAISAAIFLCLARGFRRGLTPRLALAIGALMTLGFATKLNFIGIAPGVLLALALLARRAARRSRRRAYGSLALGLGLALGPVCVYAAINLISGHAALGALSRGISSTGTHRGSLPAELSYIWQFYLPRLPGMTNYFPGISTTRQIWFDKSVGLYGWLDTYFPGWVYDLALIPAALIAALCVRELLRARAALRSRAAELSVYAVIGVGLLVLFGADSYLEVPTFTGSFSEPRYLLPLTVLFAAVLALAARGAGRRWGPAVGALLVLLILAQDLFSQLLVVGRFYG
jgi:Predicted membrane protein (DUF2142)